MKSTLGLLLMTLCSHAEDFCALRINVYSSPGIPLDGARVELIDENGRVERVGTSVSGVVEICDFSFGIHTLVLFKDRCMPIQVNHVRIYPNYTHKISVVSPTCPHFAGTLGTSSCEVFLRASTMLGPLDNAVARTEGTGSLVKADRYGRMIFAILLGSSVRVELSSPGLAPKTLDLKCPDKPVAIQKDVVFEIR